MQHRCQLHTDFLLLSAKKPQAEPPVLPLLEPGFDGLSAAAAPTKTIVLNTTQPILTATGQLRWAINNVAQPTSKHSLCAVSKLQNSAAIEATALRRLACRA